MLKKPRLLVTRHHTELVEGRIAREFQANYNPFDRPFTPQELLEAAEGMDALFVSPADKLDGAFFASVSKSVKVIATFSVGFEHVDLAAAARAGIPVANTPDVLSDATADVAMLLLLAASRRAHEAQEIVRSGEWPHTKSGDRLGWQLTGKVLGIYGMGRIGQAVAHRARAFGMEIHYCNRTQLTPAEELGAVFHASPEELLGVSKFLSLHAPSTPETQHFLNARTIAMLPAGAIVVNTARGGLIHDEDLIAALKSGQLAAAGLDVFQGEPNINPDYLDLPNVFLLPHIGSATVETRTAMGMLALDNIFAVLNGTPAPSLLPTPAST